MLRGFACNELSDKCQQPNVACEESFFASFFLLGNGGYVHCAVQDHSAAPVTKTFSV